jgi:hypothetical protein
MKKMNPWGLAQVIYTGCWAAIMTAQNLARPEQVQAIKHHDEFSVAVLYVIMLALLLGIPYLFGKKAAQRE